MSSKHCELEGIACDTCMNHGIWFLGCCKLECGTHFYCDQCSRKDKYLSERKQVDSDK